MGRVRRRGATKGASRTTTLLLLAAGGAVILLAAVLAFVPLLNRTGAPPTSGPRTENQTIVISMAGFAPSRLTARAGRPITLTIVNPDSQFHADGGGWHQFAIDTIGIDVRVAPRSQQTITLGPLAAGRYEFYCDVCCGGRANPSMLGVLEVQG